MSKEMKVERVTCKCGEVIAGCVYGEQDAQWRKSVLDYMKSGCAVDIIAVEDFKFGQCLCEDQPTKKRFKLAQ